MMLDWARGLGLALMLASLTLDGCATQSTSPLSLVPQAERRAVAPASGRFIKHVIIVVQENRTFENIFAGFPGADAPTFGYTHDGGVVPLRPIDFTGVDENHSYEGAITAYDGGKMDGFDTVSESGGDNVYAYLERNLVAPYWDMARNYVLADHMFPTEFGGSFAAHLDLIAGTAELSPTLAEVDNPSAEPWGCDAPASTTTTTLSSAGVLSDEGPFPCFDQFQTMANLFDAAKLSWRYYAPAASANGYIWSSFDAIKAVREGSDWNKDIVSPQTRFLKDAVAGNLPAVSWVVPDYADSDHAGNNSDTGPSWVAAVVNAVGKGKDWNSSAIVVLWDDWGGWYDNAPPPQLDFTGLGIRVPCIIVSPYAKEHYVSRTQYEFGSILQFVEQTFNLPSLSYTDARATSIADSFDFTQAPRKFSPIAAHYPPSHFLRRKASLKPPDND